MDKIDVLLTRCKKMRRNRDFQGYYKMFCTLIDFSKSQERYRTLALRDTLIEELEELQHILDNEEFSDKEFRCLMNILTKLTKQIRQIKQDVNIAKIRKREKGFYIRTTLSESGSKKWICEIIRNGDVLNEVEGFDIKDTIKYLVDNSELIKKYDNENILYK